jgi:hypothetical protein
VVGLGTYYPEIRGNTVYKGYSVIKVLQMVKIKREFNTMLTTFIHPT